jgi:hypothetical protein
MRAICMRHLYICMIIHMHATYLHMHATYIPMNVHQLVHRRVLMHIFTRMHSCSCTHVGIHMHATYIHMNIHMHATHLHMHATHKQVNIHQLMHICVLVHIFTHMNTRTHSCMANGVTCMANGVHFYEAVVHKHTEADCR